MLLGNLDNLGILEQRRVRGPERRIGLRHDAVVVQILDEIVLGQIRMQLDLIGGWDYRSRLQEVLEEGFGEAVEVGGQSANSESAEC